ncbi:MAG: hypothetical protein JXK04_08345 [Campylobacterales bacterium]|nr:hypothetical protein [Campylobacterales bacterium]
MKKTFYAISLAGCLFASAGAASFDVGISGSDRGISGFALSIGDYYHVPAQEVVVLERRIPRDELSVVYFLSRHSHRDARYITDLRMRGLSWWDVSLRLGLDPRVLYVVDSRRHSGPPYGRAYGYHKNGNIHRLRDHEIVELVNVRFLSDYHRVHVDDVIDRRRKGERYYYIDDHYRGKKMYPKHREDVRERRDYRDDRREYRDDRRDRRDDRRDYRNHRDDRRDYQGDHRDRDDDRRTSTVKIIEQ